MANIGIAQNAALQIMDLLQKAENTLENANSITANVHNSLDMEVASRANIDQNLTAIRRVFNNSQERINRVITVGREAVSESDQRDHTQQQRSEQVQMNSSIPVLGGTAAIGFLGLHGIFSSISKVAKDWIKNIINPVVPVGGNAAGTASSAAGSSGSSLYSVAGNVASSAKNQAEQQLQQTTQANLDDAITGRFSEFAATKGPNLKNDYYDENGRWKSSGCCAFVDYAYEDVYGRSFHSITNDVRVHSETTSSDIYGFLKGNGARAGDVLWCHYPQNGKSTTHYMIINKYDEDGVWITDGYFKNGKMNVWCNNEKVSYTGSGGHAQAYFNGSCYLSLYKMPDDIRNSVNS